MKRACARLPLVLISFCAVHIYSLALIAGVRGLLLPGLAVFALINLFPSFRKGSSVRLRILADGAELLILFCCILVLSVPYGVWLFFRLHPLDPSAYWIDIGVAAACECVLFWNGILRVYLTSVQLGIRRRVLGIVCGPIPVLQLVALFRIISVATEEVSFETRKHALNKSREGLSVCGTKYPLLLVHGVFFRDVRQLNYWGRIPGELIQNGAAVYYGEQDSAASVEESGRALARRIREIVEETGCGKVNIIAHSKGGLDSRYAVSMAGAADVVASLTTVNTPHRGCLFADHLIERLPEGIKRSVADKYNGALLRLGDASPDFLAAVGDLTASACVRFNEAVPDQPGVLYQSVGSKMTKARGGKFPLNMSYPLVRHFDGDCDGLVAVESMKWGGSFTLVSPSGKRGVSHGDMIDLNRENISGFDVREFYVQLAAGLKGWGL